MRLAGDREAAQWLGGLNGGRGVFEWDAGNRTKNRKHGVETDDVEGLLQGPFVFEGRIVDPAHKEPRWLLLGADARGRRLALIFTRRGDRLRPISCRPMRDNERRRYEKAFTREA
ncbi:MAG: BrnT family toxin [Myxococcota bacterium]